MSDSEVVNEKDTALKSEYTTNLRLLQEREWEIDCEIEKLSKESEGKADLKTHMDLLHAYNDIKDAAQIVIGSLANLRCVSVKELHEKFGLLFEETDQ